MSSESALLDAIPNVTRGVDVSAWSLCRVEEKAVVHLWWYLLEVAGFDLQLFFFFFPPKGWSLHSPVSLDLFLCWLGSHSC